MRDLQHRMKHGLCCTNIADRLAERAYSESESILTKILDLALASVESDIGAD